ATQPADVVRFGHAVTVADAAGRTTTWEITGEDESDPARHRIAPQAPLARALLGAAVGDTVTWHRPSGAVALEILAIRHPD
ncbi:MAG TPA: GreA/GreB family elongation factor, partial [Paracoccaceae bacterium]|nr:GreA/GreB family elongation factor [Paracoccaceae bacterium]